MTTLAPTHVVEHGSNAGNSTLQVYPIGEFELGGVVPQIIDILGQSEVVWVREGDTEVGIAGELFRTDKICILVTSISSGVRTIRYVLSERAVTRT